LERALYNVSDVSSDEIFKLKKELEATKAAWKQEKLAADGETVQMYEFNQGLLSQISELKLKVQRLRPLTNVEGQVVAGTGGPRTTGTGDGGVSGPSATDDITDVYDADWVETLNPEDRASATLRRLEEHRAAVDSQRQPLQRTVNIGGTSIIDAPDDGDYDPDDDGGDEGGEEEDEWFEDDPDAPGGPSATGSVVAPPPISPAVVATPPPPTTSVKRTTKEADKVIVPSVPKIGEMEEWKCRLSSRFRLLRGVVTTPLFFG